MLRLLDQAYLCADCILWYWQVTHRGRTTLEVGQVWQSVLAPPLQCYMKQWMKFFLWLLRQLQDLYWRGDHSQIRKKIKSNKNCCPGWPLQRLRLRLSLFADESLGRWYVSSSPLQTGNLRQGHRSQLPQLCGLNPASNEQTSLSHWLC